MHNYCSWNIFWRKSIQNLEKKIIKNQKTPKSNIKYSERYKQNNLPLDRIFPKVAPARRRASSRTRDCDERSAGGRPIQNRPTAPGACRFRAARKCCWALCRDARFPWNEYIQDLKSKSKFWEIVKISSKFRQKQS